MEPLNSVIMGTMNAGMQTGWQGTVISLHVTVSCFIMNISIVYLIFIYLSQFLYIKILIRFNGLGQSIFF